MEAELSFAPLQMQNTFSVSVCWNRRLSNLSTILSSPSVESESEEEPFIFCLLAVGPFIPMAAKPFNERGRFFPLTFFFLALFLISDLFLKIFPASPLKSIGGILIFRVTLGDGFGLGSSNAGWSRSFRAAILAVGLDARLELAIKGVTADTLVEMVRVVAVAETETLGASSALKSVS